MILIGSSAIKHWYPELNRIPKDHDYAISGESQTKSLKGQHRVEMLQNPLVVQYCGDQCTVAPPDVLYTIKMSHLFWDINWSKHEWDATFLRNKGAKLIKPLFNDLYEYWNEVHGKNKRSDLKMSAEDFFDNAVPCDYSHDDLHTLLNIVPTYTKVLIGEVEVGEDKFNELSFEEKCDLVTEEVMVMAFERYHKKGYQHAYSRMLKKFILSHAPIWEGIFILENYPYLCRPKFNYFKTIEENLFKLNKK